MDNVIFIEGFAVFVVIGALAFIVESGVEYFFAPVVDLIFGKKVENDPKLKRVRGIVMKILAALVGLGLSFWYQYDLIHLIGLVVGTEINPSWVGYILTGISLARGAGYVHDLVKKFTDPVIG